MLNLYHRHAARASIIVSHEVGHALDHFSLVIDNKKQSSGTNKFICHVLTCQDGVLIVIDAGKVGEHHRHHGRCSGGCQVLDFAISEHVGCLKVWSFVITEAREGGSSLSDGAGSPL